MIILASVLRQLSKDYNIRRAARLRALYRDRRRRCVLFDNLHRAQTAPASVAEIKSGGDLLAAGDWYYSHLSTATAATVIIVSDTLAETLGCAEGSTPGSLDPGVHVLTQQQYFAGRWAAVPAVADVYESLAASRAEAASRKTSSTSSNTKQYISESAVAQGLADGTFVKCMLSVSSRDSSQAVARPVAGQQSLKGVRIMGKGAMNRALHGDVVAVRLLPQEESKSHAIMGGDDKHLDLPSLDESTIDSIDDSEKMNLVSGPGHNAAAAPQLTEEREEKGRHEGDRDDEVTTTTEAEAATDMDTSFLSGAADDVAESAVTGDADDHITTAGIAGSGESGSLENLPVGEVVAVLQRSVQEIVACIAEDDESALTNLAGREAGAGFALSVLCIPVDRRLPRLRIRSRQLQQLTGKRLVVRIDDWDVGSHYPRAHVLRVLGPIGDLRSETDAVLVASGVRWEPFGEPALRELPPLNGPDGRWMLSSSDLASEVASGRKDLRGDDYFIVSIDPPGCTDVDDAMHVRFLRNHDATGSSSTSVTNSSANSSQPGTTNGSTSIAHDQPMSNSRSSLSNQNRNSFDLIEVGVHIADVSYFVPEGSALDAEASARCTTVYLVDRRLDMLPGAISEDAASLVQNKDRLALSVLWTMREEPPFEVESVWFGRTLIRSRHQLEYSDAQNILEGKPTALGHALPSASTTRLVPALRVLASLADVLRQKRMDAGAVELESAEMRFITGSNGQPTGVSVKSELQMMRIVAEMMIFANAAVAERIYRAAPRAALLRRHAPPREQGLAELAELCESLGLPLPPKSSLASEGNSGGFGAILRDVCARASPAMATLIRATATRAMSEAQYFCTGDTSAGSSSLTDNDSTTSGIEILDSSVVNTSPSLGHFGLALPFYTHFTSPIRRYADIVVHRQLLGALALQKGRKQLREGSLSTITAAADDVLSSGSALGGQRALLPLLPSTAEVSERALVMNERHRAAKRAQKGCADLFLLMLLHTHPSVERAVVVGITGKALRVFIPKYHTKVGIILYIISIVSVVTYLYKKCIYV